jgi:hypothetical protein
LAVQPGRLTTRAKMARYVIKLATKPPQKASSLFSIS